MGVEARRVVIPLLKKESIVFNTVVSGAPTLPGPNEITIVTMLAAADTHRLLEVQNRIIELINFLLEKDFLSPTAADQFIAMKIFESKAAIRPTAFAGVVTGDIAISLDALIRAPGAKNWIYEAYLQTMDRMREIGRLTE